MHYIACWWFRCLSLIAIGVVVTFLCGSVACSLLCCFSASVKMKWTKMRSFNKKVELSFALHVYLIGVIREFLFLSLFLFFPDFFHLSHTHAVTHLISHLSIYSRVIFHAEFNLRLLNWSTLDAFTTNTHHHHHIHIHTYIISILKQRSGKKRNRIKTISPKRRVHSHVAIFSLLFRAYFWFCCCVIAPPLLLFREAYNNDWSLGEIKNGKSGKSTRKK